MWIYKHVDGDLELHLRLVVFEMTKVEAAWRARAPARLHPLRQALAEITDGVTATMAHGRGYDWMTRGERAVAHAGFTASRELAQHLRCVLRARSGRPDVYARPPSPTRDPLGDALVGACMLVDSFLEEWRPYISYGDIAIALTRLDDVPYQAAMREARALGRPVPAVARAPRTKAA